MSYHDMLILPYNIKFEEVGSFRAHFNFHTFHITNLKYFEILIELQKYKIEREGGSLQSHLNIFCQVN